MLAKFAFFRMRKIVLFFKLVQAVFAAEQMAVLETKAFFVPVNLFSAVFALQQL